MLADWRRPFQVWNYTVSHSTLLLRSVHVEGFDTRIDVAFANVGLMLLRSSYNSLSVFKADEAEKEELAAHQPVELDGMSLFLLNDRTSYVLAANCAWHEDHGDHHTPSRFGPLRGTE
ncbi:hypothetical protein [Sphaerisporangium sp. NPDC051011]|uniref:hypothetical protein n=1 Tax=Sphaerisporangium sp. NPDC051011 TaxID=3155792 RepID=UPI0033FC6860